MLLRLLIIVSIFAFFTPPEKSEASHVDCQELHAAAFLDEPLELQELIAHGTDLDCRDVINQTPLITATDGASFNSFSLLLANGANITARDEIGQTALDKALEKHAYFDMKGGETYRELYQRMIDMLIAAGAGR